MRSKQELQMLQALPLEIKIAKTKLRIREFVNRFGVESCYISFSGGKDSTVLLHIIRQEYPDMKAVFADTGLEYPEIREFVKSFENVEIVRPKMSFKDVIVKYGYPIVSKEVSKTVYYARINDSKWAIDMLDGKYMYDDGKSRYNKEKYKSLLTAPFCIANHCCDHIKKSPLHKIKKNPFIAVLADESDQRQSAWIRTGCNVFDSKKAQSKPMLFWLEQDVLQYIKQNNIEIASVYGDIVCIDEQEGEEYYSTLDNIQCKKKTTGCTRTG